MKITALTICQPYAHLIVTPLRELPPDVQRKRVENRTWAAPRHLIGKPLAIHAGKSKTWLQPEDDRPGFDSYGIEIAKMAFGAVVGVGILAASYPKETIDRGSLPEDMRWLSRHEHTEGPHCWVLSDVRRFATPYPAKGALGPWWWEVPAEIEEKMAEFSEGATR